MSSQVEDRSDSDGRIYACTRCGDWTGLPAAHLVTVHGVLTLKTNDFTLIRGSLHKRQPHTAKPQPYDTPLFP